MEPNPGTKSWVPRGHAISWWTSVVTTGAILMTTPAMGIMIGVALGLPGVFASSVAGSIIDNYGFTTHYIVLAVIVLLGLTPLSRIRETVRAGHHA